MPSEITISPIGWVESVFKEKFGAPRQSGVVPSALGIVHFHPPYDTEDAFAGINGYSHLWLITQFHLTPPDADFRPKVRPPKLGGKQKVGVFASRSPFRPNRLCLTKVRLEEVMIQNQKVKLKVSGLDLVEGTPLLDIKPYLPYADADKNATATMGLPPQDVMVRPADEAVFSGLSEREVSLITETLRAQPQPAHAKESQSFGLTLESMNIHWHIHDNGIIVTAVEKIITPL